MTVQLPVEFIWGIIGYILITTGGFIWWAATVNEKLSSALTKLKEMNDANLLYARKEDVARELGVIERNQETMWGKFDKLKEKVDTYHATN